MMCQTTHTHLDLATNAGQETAIDKFTREDLRTLGFEERGLALRSRHNILQEDEPIFNPSDPEAQVIAEVIAAYQYNNLTRQRIGLLPLDAMTVPCITMVGTCPTFYLVPITKASSDAVTSGQLPSVRTEVLKCVTVAGHNRRSNEGMEKPEYRKVERAFQRFLAFKALAKSHWEKFLLD